MSDGRLNDCKQLIKDQILDLIYLLKTKLILESSSSLFHSRTLRLFPFEDSYNNFSSCIEGRICLKWNSSKVSLEVIISTPQIIHGLVKVN